MNFDVRYLDADGLSALDPDAAVLGLVSFAGAAPPQAERWLTVELPLPTLGPAEHRFEAWLGRAPVRRWTENELHLARSGDLLFGCARLSDVGTPQRLERETRGLYERLFRVLDGAGRPHLLRVYNYIPGITARQDGAVRYHAFNAGRYDAFVAAGRSVAAAPAASALGVEGHELHLYFLAASRPGSPLENTRQVSAYRYPPEHGARSPTFSRAMTAEPGGAPFLFISGTASIVSHNSRHPGDVAAQTEEIARNVGTLLAGCAARGLRPAEPLRTKIYLRHPHDAATVAQSLAGAPLGTGALFLRADICREELLVEVEALGRLTTAPAAG